MVAYQGLLSIKDSSRNMLEDLDLTGGDPLEALIKYTRSKNLRLVDLFAQFDIDKSGSMTRQELIHGVAVSAIASWFSVIRLFVHSFIHLFIPTFFPPRPDVTMYG